MSPQVEVLVTAAREIAAVNWVFTGFNWPVLAARLARRATESRFVQVLEGGAALDRDTDRLMSSTTDHHALYQAMCWRGSSADVLRSIVPRCDLVVLDAANVDIRGRTNSTAVGAWSQPIVRLPGGGGAPDASWSARRLLLLLAGGDPSRIVRAVEHTTTSPRPDAEVRLITRWGVLALGATPLLETFIDTARSGDFLRRLDQLEVPYGSAAPHRVATSSEFVAAEAVLHEARSIGYRIPLDTKGP